MTAWVYGAEPADFAHWNPSIDQNEEDATTPTYDYDCKLALSVSYCVELSSPTPGMLNISQLDTVHVTVLTSSQSQVVRGNRQHHALLARLEAAPAGS